MEKELNYLKEKSTISVKDINIEDLRSKDLIKEICELINEEEEEE